MTDFSIKLSQCFHLNSIIVRSFRDFRRNVFKVAKTSIDEGKITEKNWNVFKQFGKRRNCSKQKSSAAEVSESVNMRERVQHLPIQIYVQVQSTIKFDIFDRKLYIELTKQFLHLFQTMFPTWSEKIIFILSEVSILLSSDGFNLEAPKNVL